ncbi:hypothetical protein DAEQUDRAFT_119444 [Daedalea quercina L-15889]|uniref:Cyclin N-terminal domain-containing protein n=1 Tax=Daedalea quercina L-15889 TaxID=1314783 RepID=A0A165KRK4_9APHY|nr:hypothetical protein DAEQUDRAFT_119444 [Daedalea quercina L-15889]
MEREALERRADGLAMHDGLKLENDDKVVPDSVAYTGTNDGESSDSGEDEECRMILQSDRATSNTDSEEESASQSIFALADETCFGIDEHVRMTCVDWILEVLPDTSDQPTHLRKDLSEHLRNSPETRWHAAQLFIRYFHHLGAVCSCTASPVSASGRQTLTEEALLAHDGSEAIVWDCAIACVALSVKFHRDVFPPFYMIPAREWGALAPHTISYDDLEIAQRDILDTLSHSIGCVTPGQYLHDFWLALPSLRALLAFDKGWEAAQEEAWAILLEAFMQPDVLRFPTSLLTACALIDGCVDVLIGHYKTKLHASSSFGRRRPSSGADGPIRKDRNVDLRKRATRAVQNVKMDAQELLGYTEVDFRYCRFWLRSAP